MSGHGIGHPPQPNPSNVVVSREKLLFHPPCCCRPVPVDRGGLEITLPKVSQRLECPSCGLWWQADLRVSRDRLSASWLRAQKP
ncbi:MAG: hypothetical protein ACRDZO_07690 [Egibacteraceae bacterium]